MDSSYGETREVIAAYNRIGLIAQPSWIVIWTNSRPGHYLSPSSVGWSSSSIHLVDVPSRGRQIIRRFHLKMEEDLQQPIPYSQ
jgi:hypothetical protein